MKNLFILFAIILNAYFATAQWVKIDSPSTKSLFKIKFADKNTGYAVGEMGTIIKSNDGGDSWKSINYKNPIELKGLFCLDSNKVYVVGEGILKTVNGGKSWNFKSIDKNNCLHSIYFVDSINGYAVGTNGLILKTIDSGENWTKLKIGTIYDLNDVYFFDKNAGYVGGSEGLFKTNDGGNTWICVMGPIIGVTVNSISFCDLKQGCVIGDNAFMYIKEDDETWSWIEDYIFDRFDFNSVTFPCSDIGYVVGDRGAILKTNDAGQKWTVYCSTYFSDLYSVYFTDTIVGLAVGANGTILKTINGGGPLCDNPLKDFNCIVNYRYCNYAMATFSSLIDTLYAGDVNYWDFGDGKSDYGSAREQFSHTYSKPGIYSPSLTFERNGISKTVTKHNFIAVRKPPTVSFEIDSLDRVLYAPVSLTFLNQTIKGDGDTLWYLWDFDDNYTSTETNPVHTFSLPGRYHIVLNVKDNFSCDFEDSKYIQIKDTIQLREFNYITNPCSDYGTPSCGWGKHFIIQNDTLKIYGQIGGNCCTTKTATVTAKPDTIFIRTFEYGPECTCGCSYCFAINVPNITKDSIIVSFDGQLFTASTTLSNKDTYLMNNDIKIFPNPVKTNFTIDFSALNQKNYKIEIYSISGDRVYENKLIDKSRININSEGFIPGIYFVKTLGDNATRYLNKIVIE